MIFNVDNVGISPYRDPKTVRRRNGRNGWVKSRHVRRRTLDRFGKIGTGKLDPHILQFHELVYDWFMFTHNPVQRAPQTIAKLVNDSNFTNWFMIHITYNEHSLLLGLKQKQLLIFGESQLICLFMIQYL